MPVRFLLDVNVLIALLDRSHVQHDAAHKWFVCEGQGAWATCPLTENGVMRVVGNPLYPNSHGTLAAVTPLMAGLCALRGHCFGPTASAFATTSTYWRPSIGVSWQVRCEEAPTHCC